MTKLGIVIAKAALLATAVTLLPVKTMAQKFVITKVAEKSLATLPEGDLYWTAETFPSIGDAEAAAGETSVSAEIDGKTWLFTIGPEDRVGHGGEWVTSVGPIARFDAPEYMMRINITDSPPGTKTSIHSHPGSEALHVLTGEVTVRWPEHTDVVAAGDSLAGQPPHTPMEAASTGDETLVQVVMFVVDPTQEFSKPAALD